MSHLNFIFDWFIGFFNMPLALPLMASFVLLSFLSLANKILRGGF